MSETIQYILIGLLIVSVFIVSVIVKKRKARKETIRKLSDHWGCVPDERCKAEELDAIAGYHANVAASEKGRFFIDSITWNDLDMDKVFQRINSTATSIGEEYLFNLLREPVFTKEELEERERVIGFFMENPEERLKLQTILAQLGKNRFAGISDYFIGDKAQKSHEGKKYLLLLAAFILSPLLFLVSPGLGLFAIIGMFFLNVTVHYKAKQMLSAYLDSLSYIVNMTRCAKKLAALDIPDIKEYTGLLDKTTRRIHSLSMNSFYLLFYRSEDPFLEYVKVVFLGELIAFESLMKKIRKYKEELHTLFVTIGFLDSMLSTASYRDSLEYYTIPDLTPVKADLPEHLEFIDIYHPLIGKPVANSLTLSGSALITGSNASGKSTFLKTAAINGIFAQTLHTCLAEEYHSSYFRIYSSMALRDSLFNNESYYVAEIKSLKRIFDALDAQTPCLCMIDEVLRGTNTIERIAASSEVLYRLSRDNCICVAATHDLELTHILGRSFENYHFQESFQDNEIIFDYKLYAGKSTTRNAIKLLRVTGYDESIADRAEQHALDFVRDGRWKEMDGDGDVSA